MIKAILFDFDGVLTIDKTGAQSIIKYIVSNTGIPFETFKTCYYKYNNGLLMGHYTHRDIWKSLCRDLGTDIDYSVLLDAFKHTALDTDMIEFVKELHGKYKTGIVTDNKRDRIDVISEIHNFGELFDTISVSADSHSGKENRAIFEKTTASLGVLPSECIFTDNTASNLTIPREMGMITLLFDDETRDIQQFKSTVNSLIREAKDGAVSDSGVG